MNKELGAKVLEEKDSAPCKWGGECSTSVPPDTHTSSSYIEDGAVILGGVCGVAVTGAVLYYCYTHDLDCTPKVFGS